MQFTLYTVPAINKQGVDNLCDDPLVFFIIMPGILFFQACLVCFFSFCSRALIPLSILYEPQESHSFNLFIFLFQQSQGGGIVLRVEEKARAGVVWGNKQNPTIRTQRNSSNSISDSIYSSAQDGGIKNTIPTERKETPIKDCNTISSK